MTRYTYIHPCHPPRPYYLFLAAANVRHLHDHLNDRNLDNNYEWRTVEKEMIARLSAFDQLFNLENLRGRTSNVEF